MVSAVAPASCCDLGSKVGLSLSVYMRGHPSHTISVHVLREMAISNYMVVFGAGTQQVA